MDPKRGMGSAVVRLLAVLLIAYLPGWVTIWRIGAGDAAAGAPFLEILASAALTSWVGFTLAEWGAFSLANLCALLGGYTVVVGWSAARRGARLPPPQGTGVLAGVAIVVLGVGLYLPAFDTSIMASDASFYRAAGMHLERTGGLVIEDPLLAELPPWQRKLLFEPAAYGGFARIPGGILLQTVDATVAYPTFARLLPVWIALASSIGGPGAVGLVGPAFAVLALWAIWLVARDWRGPWLATLAALLVATNLGQWYFARFLMPEVLAEAFIWGGLATWGMWWSVGGNGLAAIAALALGVAGLARVEELVLLPLAIALFIGWQARWPRGTMVFAAILGAVALHGFAHVVLVPGHYRDVLTDETILLGARLPTITRRVVVVVGMVVAGATVATVQRRGGVVARRLAVLVVAAVATTVFAMRSNVAVGMTGRWLVEASSWLVVGTSLAGVALLESAPPVAVVVLAVAGLPFVWDPHVTPTMLWGVRRFVPVVIPWMGLLAVGVVARLAHQSRTGAAALAMALIVTGAWPLSRVLWLPLHPTQAAPLADLAGKLPGNAITFVAPELTAYLIHLPLWFEHRRAVLVAPAGLQWATTIAQTATALARSHPIVFIGHGFGPAPPIPGFEVQARATAELRTLTPELDAFHAPTQGVAHLVPLRIYDLVPVARP